MRRSVRRSRRGGMLSSGTPQPFSAYSLQKGQPITPASFSLVGGRKSKNRSRKGGFLQGIGALIKDAIVPFGFTYAATRKRKGGKMHIRRD